MIRKLALFLLLFTAPAAYSQTWVYTYGGETDYTDGTTNAGFQPQNFAYGGRITFSQAGTIDQLSVYGQEGTTGTVDVKIALYDTSGNLVVDSTLTMTTTIQWHDTATFTATSVSATDYIILYSAADADAFYGYDTANDGSFATEANATFPADPETISLEGDTSQGYGGRASFTASASSSTVSIIQQQH